MTLSSECKNILLNLEQNLETACRQISENLPALDDRLFSREMFWKNFIAASKLISHEATKLCMMFSKPPFPSAKEAKQLSDKIEATCLSFVTVYFTLPKTQGFFLHKEIHHCVLLVLQGMKELCIAARNNSAAQLQMVGNMWEKCEAIETLPKDNKEAVVTLCRNEHDVVQDASQELMNAMENEEDSEEFFIPRINGLSVPLTTWSSSDRLVLLPCSGLIKATKACLKKILISMTERGNGDDVHAISELDAVAEIVKVSSSVVDDFVLSLYPPMNHSAVREQATKVRDHCKTLLSRVKDCHFHVEADDEWICFLEKAVDHNWVKITDLVLAD